MSYVMSMFKVVTVVCIAVALCGGAQTKVWGGDNEPYALSVLKVKDFAKWKAAFDASVKMRKAAGEKSFSIFRSADDPNTVLLLIGWKSLEAARKLAKSDKLKQKLQDAGVLDKKDYYLEQAAKGSM